MINTERGESQKGEGRPNCPPELKEGILEVEKWFEGWKSNSGCGAFRELETL